MSIGEQIKEARKKAGLTQAELAEMLGVAVITIGQYERGVREPRHDQLQRIAAALGVSIATLIDPIEAARQQTAAAGVALSQALQRLDNAKGRGAPQEELQQIEAECKRLGNAFDHAAADAAMLIAFRKLNIFGQTVALERVKELAEIPKYQRAPPDQDDKDAAPPSDGPETPPEDK